MSFFLLRKEGALLGVVHGCISGIGNDIEKDHKRAKFVRLHFLNNIVMKRKINSTITMHYRVYVLSSAKFLFSMQ